MKAIYDRHTKERYVELIIWVIVRMPDQGGLLSDVWKGPYEVVKNVSLI